VASVEAKPFASASHSIFITETNHIPVVAALPGGNRLGVGEQAKILLQTKDGSESLEAVEQRLTPTIDMSPQWKLTKGDGVVSLAADGSLRALSPGDATVEVKIPGLAARSGFLFIKALGQVGIRTDGQVNWDIAGLVAGFGISLFLSQILSGWGMPANPQQATANKITPVMITGMFLFFPLPAGVLLYMVIANIFQAFQTFVLIREPLPENLQAILDQQMSQQTVTASATAISSERLPFEPKGKR
jgi:YidC/Oxa1 family membrane protein insertase